MTTHLKAGSSATTHTFFAACPKGLESLLLNELKQLGTHPQRETVGGVWFEADITSAYRACLWSRLANKVLLPLTQAPVKTEQDLYQAAAQIPWETHFPVGNTFAVDFSGTNRTIRHSQFGALRVKDAIVDRLRREQGQRPNIDKAAPDLRINARLSKGQITIALDFSGESLHRRGYRQHQGAAPLKENLAAALLLRANWPTIAQQENAALIDPMCGSATILIEAALMAADIAPGIKRARFGFHGWAQHDQTAWQALKDEAETRKAAGLANDLPEIRGYDADIKVLDAAEFNIGQAGLLDHVRVIRKPVAELKRPTHTTLENGLVLTNPPYGERLGEVQALTATYAELGHILKTEFNGWQAGVFTGNPQLGKSMGIRSHKHYQLFNGTLPSQLLLFNVNEQQFVSAPPKAVDLSSDSLDPNEVAPRSPSAEPSDGTRMLINRFKKNQKQLKNWLKHSQTNAYRLYDADIPEYAAAIDLYGEQVHIQEYQAPKSVDETKAKQRLQEICDAVAHALQANSEKVSLKQRRRNRGKSQYEKQTTQRGDNPKNRFSVTEGRAQIHVNLVDYLDTGLFLDHRPLRLRIAEEAAGKRFLNLFCYTATASVQAVLGGAKSSVNVDMSRTYLEWAKDNYKLNNINPDNHRFEQTNCVEWLKTCREGFDLILLDPPSFSNSKRMEGVFDVQRDHTDLIERCMELLSPNGKLYFSNNLRTFKLDEAVLNRYSVENITSQTLDKDFQRNQKIHQCWSISHAPSASE